MLSIHKNSGEESVRMSTGSHGNPSIQISLAELRKLLTILDGDLEQVKEMAIEIRIPTKDENQ